MPSVSTPRWRRLLVEPARPDPIRRWPGAPWLAVATVCIGAFMGQLDASIVTLALPSLRRDLHSSLGAVVWVSLSYLLVLVGTVAAVGRLADMVGRKLLYTYGFALFTLASLACGLAPSLGALVAFRAVQALGAAMLQANSVALIATTVGRDRLGRAIGLQGAAQALGLSLGPALGGVLVSLAGWRWVFYVNVPAGVVGCVLGWLLLPRTRRRAALTRFDWPGLALLFMAVICLLLALSGAGRTGVTDRIVLALLAAAVAARLFLVRERRAAAPMVDLTLFRRSGLGGGLASGMLCYLVLFGTLFVVPLFLEDARGDSVASAGLLLTAFPAAIGLIAPAAGLAADRLGPRLPTTVGMTLAAGALLAAFFATNTPFLAVQIAVLGLGVGLFTPANNSSIMAHARADQAGLVGGLLNMTRGIGAAVGIAVTSIAYSSGSKPTDGYRTTVLLLASLAGLAATLAARHHSTRHVPEEVPR